MAMDMFLVLPTTALPSGPVNAEPTLDQYFRTFTTKWAVEIRSFSLDVENATTIGSTTSGPGAGKMKLNEAAIEKSVDMLSGSLFRIAAMGAHLENLENMQLFVRKAGGTTTPKPYLVYGFDMVFITKIEWSAGEGDDLPIEHVRFAYGGLALGYYTQKADGTLGTKTQTTWNQVTNQEPLTSDATVNF
jgi:type VI secretion system secreted protein Hcp